MYPARWPESRSRGATTASRARYRYIVSRGTPFTVFPRDRARVSFALYGMSTPTPLSRIVLSMSVAAESNRRIPEPPRSGRPFPSIVLFTRTGSAETTSTPRHPFLIVLFSIRGEPPRYTKIPK